MDGLDEYRRVKELCAARRKALSFDWGARLHALLEQVLDNEQETIP